MDRNPGGGGTQGHVLIEGIPVFLNVQPANGGEEGRNGGLYDYKIHCFNGEPLFIQCIGDRNFKTHGGFQNNYDLEWNKLDWIFEDYPTFAYDVPKPRRLAEMMSCARMLSAGLPYVRTDFYEINRKVYFGEMTFYPAAGFYPYRGTWNRELDLELGARINTPNKDR